MRTIFIFIDMYIESMLEAFVLLTMVHMRESILYSVKLTMLLLYIKLSMQCLFKIKILLTYLQINNVFNKNKFLFQLKTFRKHLYFHIHTLLKSHIAAYIYLLFLSPLVYVQVVLKLYILVFSIRSKWCYIENKSSAVIYKTL